MKRFFLAVGTALILFSCGKDKGNLHISGSVEGLKKGKLYLQRVDDSKFVSIDSMDVNGKPEFSFYAELESPEVLYLYLVKDDGIDFNDRLEFFAEPGEMTITTTRDYFLPEAKIEGSDTHKKLIEYRNMMAKFAERNLEYIKAGIEFRQKNDSLKIDSVERASEKNIARGYLYTLNFALNNKDSYVAPFVALSEVFDAKLKYLDTINNSLTPEVANSKYGKALAEYIAKLKEGENKQPE